MSSTNAASSEMQTPWTPGSWRTKESLHNATYEDDKEKYDAVMAKMSTLPPLVTAGECKKLIKMLAEVGRGERFLIQGGDCAERFKDCYGEYIDAQCGVLFQMSAIIQLLTAKPTLVVGRLAGQYGKPRSSPMETDPSTGGQIYSYKGENINGIEPQDRKWDPERLLQGYWHSAACLNYMRSLKASPEDVEALLKGVDMSAMAASPEFAAEAALLEAGIKTQAATLAPGCDIFTAHEGMQLDLEECLTRPVGDEYYNLSTNLLWIGDRTRQLHMGHVEYFKGIANPIACKTGPSMKPEEIAELVQILNPNKIEGKLMIITRYGAGKVKGILPAHIKAVQATGVPVVWQVDGVHGNTKSAKGGYKTRSLDDIVAECLESLECHRECGSILGGIHIELTGQRHVTECIGGCGGVGEDDLPTAYETYCDPRLNYSQALEAAVRVARGLNAPAAAA